MSDELKTSDKEQVRETEQLDQISWELLETYEALSTIYRSADLLALSEGITHASEITLANCMEITESTGGLFYVPEDGKHHCHMAVNARPEHHEAALGRYEKFKTKPYYEDGGEETHASTASEAYSSLYVPFGMGNQEIGFVYLFSNELREYSSIDVKLIHTICGQGALAIRCFNHLEEPRDKNRALQEAFEDLKMAQDELVKAERLSALGQMSSMIVHDLKNPMGGLLGYAQLLEQLAESLTPDEIKEYAGVIIKEMRRLSNMTEEIMDFSRGMETKLNQREVTVRDLVAVAVPVIESEFSEHGMSLEWDGLDETALVLADTDKMERVLINLAVNARQAMEPGGTYRISSCVRDYWIEIVTRDSGTGIPPEFREKIFEPFKSSKGTRGLGIGLAVAKWVVEAHGGEIWLHESNENGSEFRIKLPIHGTSHKKE
ncbi:MAG: ATP-binding protein [Planctomycetota bacterium]|jgi:two-component system sensor histidine kinase HydH